MNRRESLRPAAPSAPIRGWGRRLLDLDWVVVVLAGWLAPLLAFNIWNLTYLHSEAFWLLPIAALLPRFFHETHPGSRRRRAFFWTTGIVLAAGSLLDLAFGRWILAFGPGPYVAVLAGIPLEEFIFYLLGPIAMLLVYFWADEHFLRPLSPQERRRNPQAVALLRFSPGLLVQSLVLLLAGISAKALLGGEGPWLPLYFTFLLATAYGPLLFFWPTVRPLVNWPALTLTVLYTLVTSVIWELTLGVPLVWWGYQKPAMLGLWVGAWDQSVHAALPLEAVTVWLVAPFACICFFELIKAYHYHPAEGWKAKLLGKGALPQAAPVHRRGRVRKR